MTNGNSGPAGPDQSADRAMYPLGPFMLEGPALHDALERLFKEAFSTVDVYGRVEISAEKAVQINWICASVTSLRHEGMIAFLTQRVEVLEQALRKAVPGFVPALPPGAATDADVATLILPNQSPVRCWPNANGEYPTIPAPAKSTFRMGNFEMEIETDSQIERREDGIYVADKRVLDKNAKAVPEEKPETKAPDG